MDIHVEVLNKAVNSFHFSCWEGKARLLQLQM